MNKLVHLLILFLLASCQVKQANQTGELISNHQPTSNAFSLTIPSAVTYVTGNTISLSVTFPYNVAIDTTGGSPRLQLTIGSTTRYATYSSGAGGKTLIFTYPVVVADNDTDGITVNTLELNGSLMTFTVNGTTTNCDVSTLTSQTLSSVLVDNTGPSVTAFAVGNLPGFYHVGDTISFNVTFGEAVVVTGTPRIAVAFTTGGTVNADYASGSGTTVLNFRYTITNSTADVNGFNSITSPIALNSGTIKDAAGNDASLSIAAFTAAAITYSATVLFDGRVPYVTSVSVPANGTYASAQNLDFTLTFDRAVTVNTASGTPYIAVTVGSNVRQAAYSSGTGTTSLVFRYTLVPGDTDTDGISVASSITQNSGTIVGTAAPTSSFFSPTQNNSLTIPNTTGIVVSAVQPQATSVTRNTDTTLPTWGAASADNIFIIGQQLLISVGFNTPVYVGQTGGSPRIPMTIGSTTAYATYLSGGNGQTTLVFTYTIVEGDYDNDNTITLSDIDLNGGTITDAANTNALLTLPNSLTTTKIDGVRPTVSTVTGPPAGTYSSVTGNNYQNMPFTFTWSEAVNYSSTTSAGTNASVTIGATVQPATYSSGNNTTTIVYKFASDLIAGLNDNDGITLASPLNGTATIKDQAGNTANVLTFTTPNMSTVLVDTSAPTVTSVIAPANTTYIMGESLDFTVNFSESVTVNVASGYPQIALDVGGTPRTLVPTSNGTGTSFTFSYSLVANEIDSDGVVISNSVQSSGSGYARDAAQNVVTGTFTLPDTSGVLVDSTAPDISSVTPPANGIYTAGDTITFTVNVSEAVNVTGTPRILVAAQTGTLNFDYSGGTGTTSLTFSYPVTSSDFDLDGLPSSISAISLNGGTIQDLVGNDLSSTSFSAQDLSAVYLIFPNVELWSDNTLTQRYAANGATSSSSGASSTTTCGTGTCRSFNGDDAMSVSSVNNVKYVYVAYKTNSTTGTYFLISPDIQLVDNTTDFGLFTTDASVNNNGSTSSGTTQSVTITTNSTNILETVFTSTQNYAGTVIPSAFLGGIGEVLMVSGSLSAAQRSDILTYLNTKY